MALFAMAAALVTFFAALQVRNLFHLDPESAGQRGLSQDLLPPVFGQRHGQRASHLEARRHAGVAEPYELAWQTKEGVQVDTIISPTSLHDSEGRFTGSFAVITDSGESGDGDVVVTRAGTDFDVPWFSIDNGGGMSSAADVVVPAEGTHVGHHEVGAFRRPQREPAVGEHLAQEVAALAVLG